MDTLITHSIFVPLVAAPRALVEAGHGLVSTTNLDHPEESPIVLAVAVVGANDLSLVDVFPGIFTAQHIVNFLALEVQLVLESLLDAEHVGARLAVEAELGGHFLGE